MAEGLHGPNVEAQRAGGLPLFGEGEPTDHARETDAPDAPAGRGVLPDRRDPRAEARMFPLPIPSELPLHPLPTAQHRDPTRSSAPLCGRISTQELVAEFRP